MPDQVLEFGDLWIDLRVAASIQGVQLSRVLEFGDLWIDLRRREVTIQRSVVGLSNTEFGVLAVLASRPDQTLSREEIVSQSKGQEYPATERSIDVQIVGIRRKLGRLAGHIQTVRGVGYRFSSTLST